MKLNNPVKDFSDKEIIRKFHWLISNGFTDEKAAQTIKSQTDIKSVIDYINNYLKDHEEV